MNYLLPRYCVGFMKETGTRKYHHNTVRVKEPQTVKYSLNSSEVEEIFFQCKHVLDQRFNTLVFNQNFFSSSINLCFKTKASTYRKRFFIIFYLRTIQGFLRSNKKKFFGTLQIFVKRVLFL